MNDEHEAPGAVERVIQTLLRAGRGLTLRSWLMAGLYLALSAAMVGLVAVAGLRGQPALMDALNAYLFPASWHGVSSHIVAMVLERVPPAVWANLVVLTGLQLAALTLFPLKEALSLRVERESGCTAEAPNEFPLLRQGLEELKLLGLNLAIAGLIFWLGYAPNGWRTDLASLLSHLHLAAFFAVDFLAPLAQRHRYPVERIVLGLLRSPVRPLLFGILLTLPSSLAASSGDDLGRMALIVFFANALPMAWAVLAGTRLMAVLLPELGPKGEVPTKFLVGGWALVALVVVGQGSIAAAVIGSIHHKSQILKCNYGLPLDALRIDKPSWTELLGGTLTLRGQMTVTIDNPTEFELEIESNRIVIAVDDEPWWQGSLPTLRAPAGELTAVPVPFEITLDGKKLFNGLKQGWGEAKALWGRVSGVLSQINGPGDAIDQAGRAIGAAQLRFEAARQRVSVTLFVEVMPGLEVPFYLLTPP